MDKQVQELERKIQSSIEIPDELQKNIRFTTTRLGGLFVSYESNTSSNIARLNSKVHFLINIIVGNDFGSYEGDICGLKTLRCRSIKTPKNTAKKIPSSKIVSRLNKFISDNKEFLIESIEQ